jgi:hypothetical protein
VNFSNPHINIGLPVFTIHGNHDDPAGQDNLSAVDLLSSCGLVNYFGKQVKQGAWGQGAGAGDRWQEAGGTGQGAGGRRQAAGGRGAFTWLSWCVSCLRVSPLSVDRM